MINEPGRVPAASENAGPEVAIPDADARAESLKVLLVEPHARILRFMAFVFTSTDCLVSSAANAEQALERLASEPLDLVVADVDLPGTNGLDLLRAVTDRHPGVAVVLTTGSASVDSAVFAVRHHAYDYLRKPFSVEDVQQLVDRLEEDRRRARATSRAASLTQEMARRRSAMEGLSLIGDLALQGLDTAVFVEKALDRVAAALAGDASVLVVRDEDGHVTTSRSGDRTLTDRLVERLGPDWAGGNDIGAEDGVRPSNDPDEDCATLAAVIPGAVTPLGVLGVARAENHPFSAEERDVLLGYGRLIAVSLQKIVLNERLEANLIDTISSFVVALEAKDGYLKGHSARVSLYVGEMAKVLGLPAGQAALARRAGVLHDLGKLVLRESMYQKPGALSYEGSVLMRGHPLAGADILKPLRFLAQEAEAIRRHHERYDGAGYPGGLKGDAIPLAARLIAVADAFDAMTSNRPYRPAKPIETALDEIGRNAGTQFDPAVTAAFGRIPAARLTEIARFYDPRPQSPPEMATRPASALVGASRRLRAAKGWSSGHAVDGHTRRQPKGANIIGIARAALRRHGLREG